MQNQIFTATRKLQRSCMCECKCVEHSRIGPVFEPTRSWGGCKCCEATSYCLLLACILLSTLSLILHISSNTCSIAIDTKQYFKWARTRLTVYCCQAHKSSFLHYSNWVLFSVWTPWKAAFTATLDHLFHCSEISTWRKRKAPRGWSWHKLPQSKALIHYLMQWKWRIKWMLWL